MEVSSRLSRPSCGSARFVAQPARSARSRTRVAAELRALGLEVSEDDAAGPAEAGAGNLLARLPGASDEWVMFCAHLDTVPHRGLVEVVNDGGVFRSRGETILGADNKAAVAVFMELVARHADKPPPVGIELVLTVAEEQGLRGAKAFDTSLLRSRTGFVLDHAGPVGEVIVATPTQQKILADFFGVEAHAGIKPEDGSSAIAAAAAAIARMELGRLDERTTANVGLIKGGTSGNVVPGHCWVQAEARSRDAGRAAEVAGQISDACAWGASEHGCDVDVRLEELFRGYEVPSVFTGAGAGRGGPALRRPGAGAGGDRRRQRRQRLPPRGLRRRPPRQRHRCGPHRRRAGPGRQPGEDARGLRGHRRRRGRGRVERRGRGGRPERRVSGRLKLRRGTVVSAEPLVVEVGGERRPAWADTVLLGEMREGDEVVVNVAALDLGLGSGGFDVVHVNLTRGLESGGGPEGEHVIKLNYTSLQHPVAPVESQLFLSPAMRGKGTAGEGGGELDARAPALVLPLHGHLAPAAWAAAEASPGAQVGYIQTGGGALPGSLSRDVAELRERGLLCGHITAAPAYGGEHEALSTVGALDAASRLGWDAALVGPGPGIIGSNTEFGHGGMAALDSAHAALSLRLPTLLSPRLSCGDPRERHRDVSHHTHTVLELLLAPVDVAVPAGELGIQAALEEAPGNHRLRFASADLDAYSASGLPSTTMGRSLQEDPLFFAAPLAAGRLLTE